MQSLPGSLFLVVNVLVVKGEPTRQGFLSHTTLFGPLVQHECSIHGALIISQSCSKSLTEPHYLKHEQQTLHLPHLAFFSMALICFLSLESLGRVKLDFSALTKVTAGFPAAETSVLCSLPGICHPPALPGGIFFQGLSISLTSPLESISICPSGYDLSPSGTCTMLLPMSVVTYILFLL